MTRKLGVSDSQGGRGRLRAFAPLFLWCCLAFSLIGRDVFRRLAAGTTVTFRILVEGQEPPRIPVVKLDDVDFKSGGHVHSGTRILTIEAPGLEPHERKLSVWFRAQDLGDIDLARSKGSVEILAEPRSREIRIVGAEFKSAATNTMVTTFGPLFVGDYLVSADFGFFTEERRIEVKRNEAARVEFKPAVGVLAFTTEPTAAHFLLTSTAGPRVQLQGTGPTNVECLPSGEYQLKVWRGDYVEEMMGPIKHGEAKSHPPQVDYAPGRCLSKPPPGPRRCGRAAPVGTPPLLAALVA